MRKLLHLVFAVWKSDKPFDPKHYPWEGLEDESGAQPTPAGEKPSERPRWQKEQAAGHKSAEPAQEVVTAACAPTVAPRGPLSEGTFIDFGHLKQQLSLSGCWIIWACRRGCAAAGRNAVVPARSTGPMVGAAPSA